MARLSDLQLILLSAAAARGDGSIHPLPASVAQGPGTARAIAALLRRAHIEERETRDASQVHRSDGDVRYALHVTPAGLAAIGVEAGPPAEEDQPPAAPDVPLPSPSPAKRATKAALLVTLLEREAGATLPELISATGWLPHTLRAALTGLRRKGHAVERGRRDDVTCYSIAGIA